MQVLDALWVGWGVPGGGSGARAAAAATFQDVLCWAVAHAPAVCTRLCCWLEMLCVLLAWHVPYQHFWQRKSKRGLDCASLALHGELL